MQIKECNEQQSTRTGSIPLRAGDVPVIRIEPSKGWVSLKLKELWVVLGSAPFPPLA